MHYPCKDEGTFLVEWFAFWKSQLFSDFPVLFLGNFRTIRSVGCNSSGIFGRMEHHVIETAPPLPPYPQYGKMKTKNFHGCN